MIDPIMAGRWRASRCTATTLEVFAEPGFPARLTLPDCDCLARVFVLEANVAGEAYDIRVAGDAQREVLGFAYITGGSDLAVISLEVEPAALGYVNSGSRRIVSCALRRAPQEAEQ